MIIYPAIDLFGGKAVRLFKGDYNQMTVYNENPTEVAHDFKENGATHIHLVDLEGAKSGTTPNLGTVINIKEATGLFCEIGGGIRNMETIDRYINAGVDRVILGTAAVTSEGFVERAVQKYGEKIAVGIDIKDGFVAIKGWTETSSLEAFDFCKQIILISFFLLSCVYDRNSLTSSSIESLLQSNDVVTLLSLASTGRTSYENETISLPSLSVEVCKYLIFRFDSILLTLIDVFSGGFNSLFTLELLFKS